MVEKPKAVIRETPNPVKKEVIEKKEGNEWIEKNSLPSLYETKDWVHFFQEHLASMVSREKNDDTLATKIQKSYLYKKTGAPVSLLFSEKEQIYKTLCLNIIKAIDNLYMPAKLISIESVERENQWENFLSSDQLRCIIISDNHLMLYPHLRTHYRHLPQSSQHFLDKVPLFLLPNLSIYHKTPHIKAMLWKALKQKLPLLTKR